MEAPTQAVSNPVAVVDLGEGESWWESRLLLLSGAARLARPRAVVFVATRNRTPQQFLGWGIAATVPWTPRCGAEDAAARVGQSIVDLDR